MAGFLTVQQVSELTGRSKKTILQWCRNGRLPAIPHPYGNKTTFKISSQAVSLLSERVEFSLSEQPLTEPPPGKPPEQAAKPDTPTRDHTHHLPDWVKAMEQGLMTGKVFSPKTIQIYRFYAEPFIHQYRVLSVATLEKELMQIDAKAFCKRLKLYESLTSFAKHLIRHGLLDGQFLNAVKELRPKRHIPPRKITVTADGLSRLFQACESAQDTALLTLLSNTGLRATELCSLLVPDLNLTEGYLTVKLAKGGKTRKVGLNGRTIEALQAHLASCNRLSSRGTVFLNIEGRPLTRYGLYSRVERLGEKAGVKVHPHALRRAFVTINANKGRPLVILQRSCGHSDIKTTMGYCMTSEQEVIDAMKEWD